MKVSYLFPLPVMGLGLWLVMTWMTDWVLNHSPNSIAPLQTNFYPKTWFVRSLTIISIHAQVDHDNDMTEVILTTAQDAPLQQLEFNFSLTEPSHVETALALELGTTAASIRPLISYRFD